MAIAEIRQDGGIVLIQRHLEDFDGVAVMAVQGQLPTRSRQILV